MSTGQSIASPRAPRGQHRQPSASQPGQENTNGGRHSQRRSRGGRNHNNAAHASPSKLPNAEPSFSEGGAYTTDDARAHPGPRSGKKHMRGQPSHDRTSTAVGAQTSLTDTEAITNRASATPMKNQGAYAGPTFHASPAPSALPIPKFLSRSVPAKTASGPPTPPPDHSSDSADSLSPSPSPSRAPIAIPARHEDSPLDMLFRADKAERAKNINFSPNAHQVRPQPPPLQQEYNVFPMELDGESRNSQGPPLFQSPTGHRSTTDPSKLPQFRDVQQSDSGNDVMQDLMNKLSMSQKKPNAAMETPPRQAAQAPGNFQGPQHTPSPFNTGRPSANRSVSGPSTPAQAPQDGPDFFYGNRNLSPMFKAAQGDTPKRNSSLRTEVTADSPTGQQGIFQDFPSISSGNAIDPNAFARGQPAGDAQGPANARRGSVPYGQNQQRQPNKHRQDAHQRGRGNFHGQGPRNGRPTANSPAAPAKPATTMMSFVPASVSAKPKPKLEQQLAASAPPSTTVPPPQSSAPETLALEQDLKRMLNLNISGQGVR
ncbi:hypothetical protein C7974DRAFT_362592 [Boeremia exigua]|uniref:uncharacterized protein n=1 Tax=Boeremia exigua TaxID=749465 RepID=UPI001E8D9BA9|nr:uncharacterized protein C7974DRAFT_362592 [Boeremia exigua]KAH6622250.1 hypothetical protein C7974DRAFT_362592 [Boeremia exigua]